MEREGEGEGERTELVVLVPLRIDSLPCPRKPLVKPNFFPDLEAFFAAERAALDQAVNAAVCEAVCVAGVVESVDVKGLVREGERREEGPADVCSRWTSSSRSKLSAIRAR